MRSSRDLESWQVDGAHSAVNLTVRHRDIEIELQAIRQAAAQVA